MIEIQGLTKIYHAPGVELCKAVDEFDLTIPDGAVFGLLGPAAGGKTTLLKIIGGQIEPTSGTVLINGHDVVADRTQALRQVRMVAIDRNEFAAADDAPILLLDEPEVPLNKEWLEDINQERASTIILATRSLDRAQVFCSHLAVLHHGRLLAVLSAAELADLRCEPFYRIEVKGDLDDEWSDWFNGLAMNSVAQGKTALVGLVRDQTALHGLLVKIRDLGVPLLSLNPITPTLDLIVRLLERR